MFGLGFWEIALILVITLLVLGPEKMPRIARQLGSLIGQLRRAASSFQESMTEPESTTPGAEAEQIMKKPSSDPPLP